MAEKPCMHKERFLKNELQSSHKTELMLEAAVCET